MPMRVCAARRLEGLAVFTVFTLLFGALGYWVVCVLHVVPFEALDRLTRATMVWHNDPPKLAAIGFAFPPLITVVLLPFVLVGSMGSSLVALPVCSAIFGGITMVALHRVLARAEVGPARFLLLLLIAANPLIAFAAATGGGDIVGIALITVAMGALVAWYATVDTRYLVSGGLAFAMACVASYHFIGWLLLGAGVVGVTLMRHRADEGEIEGSLVMFLTPGVFVLALWALFNAIVIGDPLSWLTDSATTTVNAASSSAISTDVAGVAEQTFRLVLAGAPIALVVLPALVACAVLQRNELAAWLALFGAFAVVTPAVLALTRDDVSQIALREALPILVVALVGIAWLHQSLPGARTLVAALAGIGLLVSIPITWNALDTYRYQSMEQAFHRAISTGEDQEGTRSRGGLEVGVLSERAMAEFLKTDGRRTLADNAQTFGVIALTGDPRQFLDRADAGDDRWRAAAARPPADVRYFLFAKNAPSDELRRLYPQAARGNDPRFLTVFDTPRYRLVAVPAGLGRTSRIAAVRAGETSARPTTRSPEGP
ncbi:hypothetical protein LRS13_11160 [Svornostia abyssi]|uniref:Glycosyltransferase RgtA/B/C/D-like domain-containing protein n=1 Tax=Svornostia abyssi TaxID=2898438 RepID=A0ABY5PN98_9ACTN|nr:hypothetical protein LRS13_11160 [Parviterribacteraceae bacterium J379]